MNFVPAPPSPLFPVPLRQLADRGRARRTLISLRTPRTVFRVEGSQSGAKSRRICRYQLCESNSFTICRCKTIDLKPSRISTYKKTYTHSPSRRALFANGPLTTSTTFSLNFLTHLPFRNVVICERASESEMTPTPIPAGQLA